jgi:hypothetical protein
MNVQPESQIRLMVPASASAPDYSKYRFRAELNWIQLEVRLQRAASLASVIDHIGVKLVTAMNLRRDGAATEFRITIENPASWREVDDLVQLLSVAFPLIVDPVVMALHISFAAYSKSRSRDQSAEMEAHLRRFTTHLGVENQQHMECVKSGHQSSDDGVETDGNVNAIDEPLPRSECRAGIERTYRMDLFTARRLSVWKRHNFTREAHHFKFRKSKPSLLVDVQEELEKIDQVGEPVNIKRCAGGGVMKYRQSTVADSKLNRRAYDALRDLTARMSGYGECGD